jgi:hypothetical protein
MRFVLAVLVVLIVAVPCSAVGTIMLSPLWAWVELAFEIEALGHSLPAAWCFAFTYAVVALAGIWLVRILARTPSRQ